MINSFSQISSEVKGRITDLGKGCGRGGRSEELVNTGRGSGGKGKHSWKGNKLNDADAEDLKVEVRRRQLK